MEYHSLSSSFGISDYNLTDVQLNNMLIGIEGKQRSLIVVGERKGHALILDYIHKYRQLWQGCKIEFVSMSELLELKTNNGVYISSEEHSDLQNEIVQIFEQAKTKRASDIHLWIEKDVSKIYFRIDRKVRFFNELIGDKGLRVIRSLFTTMCDGRSQSTFSVTVPLDARIKEVHVEKLGLKGGRLATRPSGDADGSMFVEIRLFDKNEKSLSLSSMGMTKSQLPLMSQIISAPRGIVFLTGPTNSGKSTLAHCLIESVYKLDDGLNILTVEDPIERKIKGAKQTPLICNDRGVAGELAKAWGDAISNLMRLDPDQIFIGEVRDSTSAEGVISAGETGHKVYTTMHTNKPIDVLTRLLTLGIKEGYITEASLIQALVGQRLATLLCPQCSLPYLSNREKVSSIYSDLIDRCCDVKSVKIANKEGCAYCEHTGYKGMTGLYEVIYVTAEFMKQYKEHGKQAAYDYWYLNGGETMCENAINLINSGKVDPIDIHTTVCELNLDEFLFSSEIRKQKKEAAC